MTTNATLEAHSRQLLRQIDNMREDIRMMTATLQQIDATAAGLASEMRGMRTAHASLRDRVEALEDRHRPAGAGAP